MVPEHSLQFWEENWPVTPGSCSGTRNVPVPVKMSWRKHLDPTIAELAGRVAMTVRDASLIGFGGRVRAEVAQRG